MIWWLQPGLLGIFCFYGGSSDFWPAALASLCLIHLYCCGAEHRTQPSVFRVCLIVDTGRLLLPRGVWLLCCFAYLHVCFQRLIQDLVCVWFDRICNASAKDLSLNRQLLLSIRSVHSIEKHVFLLPHANHEIFVSEISSPTSSKNPKIMFEILNWLGWIDPSGQQRITLMQSWFIFYLMIWKSFNCIWSASIKDLI